LASQDQVRPILVVKRRDETLSIAAQGMLELIERQIGLMRRGPAK
jgi:hypothetical protein